MTTQGNSLQRQTLARRCQDDPAQQEEIRQLCKHSFALWCNLFAWTYVIFQTSETGERTAKLTEKDMPFTLWPCQIAAIDSIMQAWSKGREVALQKSRDMGGTWLVIAWSVWMALFHGAEVGLCSRKADLVYRAGDPDALFTKVDYLLTWLPDWMRGPLEEREMLRGFESGGTITGETTNGDAFRGGRKQIIILDEAAAMQNLEAILRACGPAGIVIMVATHEPASHFLEVCTSGRADVVTLGWWDHPEKALGREKIINQDTGEEDWTSPWLRAESKVRSPLYMALNIRIDPSGGGSMVFDYRTITRQIAMYGRAPSRIGNIRLAPGVVIDPDAPAYKWPMESLEFVEVRGGYWSLWCELIADEDGRIRPDQRHSFAFGIDIGDGVDATPSVISVVDADTGSKIARYLSRDVRPETFAHVVYQAAHWFGGAVRLPLIVPEANGGRGVSLVMDFLRWGYPRMYRHVVEGKVSNPKTQDYGWVSNRPRKKTQISDYANSLFRGLFRNPDVESLEQARGYIFYQSGGLGPASGVDKTDEALTDHGDMVIADMLADLGRRHSPLLVPKEAPPPPHSIAAARAQRERRALQNADVWRA